MSQSCTAVCCTPKSRHERGSATGQQRTISRLYLPASALGITMDLSVVSERGGMAMAGESSGYVGNIPQHYDQNLGPLLFTDYAADLARRVATLNPCRVLETAAGTGILTRALRDALPAKAGLTATDLNTPMLEIAATKFRPGESVEIRTADATALPFADASFDAIACQFGVMFFPDKDKSYREAFRVLAPGGH